MSETKDIFGGLIPKEGDAVDLGLPSGTRWAPYNVGADELCSQGAAFVRSVELYDEITGVGSDGTKRRDFSLDKDIATVCWGEPWRLPTVKEFQELINVCEWHKVEKDKHGTPGCRIHRVGNESVGMFLPVFAPVDLNFKNAGKCALNAASYCTDEILRCDLSRMSRLYIDDYNQEIVRCKRDVLLLSGVPLLVRPVFVPKPDK